MGAVEKLREPVRTKVVPPVSEDVDAAAAQIAPLAAQPSHFTPERAARMSSQNAKNAIKT